MTALLLCSGVAWAGPLEDAHAAYERGDYITAHRIWRSLAVQGNRSAQSSLGVMYKYGAGTPQDLVESAKWYRLAAEQGDAEAQLNIGTMYQRGEGVLQDYVEGAKWHRLAAEQGNQEAQAALGVSYDFGKGVRQDIIRAHMWANLAAAAGHRSAATLRDDMTRRMNSQQIAEAQKLARECQQRNFKGCD